MSYPIRFKPRYASYDRGVFAPSMVIILVLLGLTISVPAFLILPGADDWTTSVPIPDWEWSNLLPGLFWRPFEQLMRGPILGNFPVLYPLLPHLAAVFGHLLSGWLVFLLVGKLLNGCLTHCAVGGPSTAQDTLAADQESPMAAGSWNPAIMAALLLLVMPGGMAAVWSLDSMVQTWSTACGLYALYLVLRAGEGGDRGTGGNRGKHRWLWVIPCWGAVLFKESGISWFVVAPLFWLFSRTAPFRSHPRFGSFKIFGGLFRVGVGAILVYFVLRFSLSGVFGLGSEAGNRYAVHWDVVKWFVHGLMLLGVAALPVDTVALFGREPDYWRAVVTLLPAVPLFFLLGWALFRMIRGASAGRRKREGEWESWGKAWRRAWALEPTLFLPIVCVAAILAVLAAPHVPMGSVSEMYSHPLIAVLALLVGLIIGKNQMSFAAAGGAGFSADGEQAHGRQRLWGASSPAISTPVSSSVLRRGRAKLWGPVWMAAVVMFVIGSLCINYHKFTEMRAAGLAAEAVGERMAATLGPEPVDNLCVYRFDTDVQLGYSVFQMRPDQASGWGKSVISHWGWRAPSGFRLVDQSALSQNAPLSHADDSPVALGKSLKCDRMIRLSPDGKVSEQVF